ncbi:hypothetical protein K402DRAFT_421138 [Aulographum hederae CBS 113979]|uniref:Velvet domain-containing protein n=1 Tax=Aulographum hederae CBS 113979 TaxID=1176131 RepID=A0A6G1H0D5_9PEZI|nr:hypothetical protein K402DRAFT_421138 [Aulographum hederae CBS 113979]
MTETQNAPSFPPPSFLDYSLRRLPQPVQLPPLTIPPPARHHEQQQYGPPRQPLPSIHSAPLSNEQHARPFSGRAAPLENLLSPHPFTPPRSDPAYSPQYDSRRSPPRSAVEARMPPRRYVEPLEEPRQINMDQPYGSPVEQHTAHRQPYAPLPSPGYTPSYPRSNHSYRNSVGSVRGPMPGNHGPVAYSEGPPITQRAVHDAGPPRIHTQERPDYEYELRVRQQPIAARACGFGERDRRVIDPPPIIQLMVKDPRTGIVDLDELRYSLNVVHCTLWNADGTNEETALIQPDRRTTRRLMGQLVASPSVAKDEHDVEGCFFCFPDLSCRTHGKYRLRFVLMRIDPMNLQVGGFSPILTDVLSDVFTVYTAKDFPGMRPSSALTRALKLQGCNIQVKKGNEKALARKRITPSDEDDEDGPDGRNRRRRKE